MLFNQVSDCSKEFAALKPEIIEYIINLNKLNSIYDIVKYVLDISLFLIPKINNILITCNEILNELNERFRLITEDLNEKWYFATIVISFSD